MDMQTDYQLNISNDIQHDYYSDDSEYLEYMMFVNKLEDSELEILI
jgi:hypothetical protein